jgi:Ran GTPase-activating protein (RanGAP) involved in mRNA processing and transport
LDAVVDAALTLRLPSLTLFACNVTPASAPALARLIRGGALAELDVWNNRQQLLDQPAAALIADALRGNNTLTSLKLQDCGFWHDAAAAALILGGLTAHRSLRTLDLSINFIHPGDQHVPALGAALGALVAANSPALHELQLWQIAVDEAGLLALGPLLDALPLNTHLRMLNLDYTRWTDDFARDRLLPAVRANTSLRHLTARTPDGTRNEFMHEAEALVAARNAAAP